MDTFKHKGIITYNPKRNVNNDWWLTIELKGFAEVARYYRWFIDTEWWKADSRPYKRGYHKPPHSYHVSIIRGEKPKKNIDKWGKYMAKKRVVIDYSPYIRQTTLKRDGKDHFWFLDAWYEKYADLRKFYGLDYERDGVPFKGHITICRSF